MDAVKDVRERPVVRFWASVTAFRCSVNLDLLPGALLRNRLSSLREPEMSCFGSRTQSSTLFTAGVRSQGQILRMPIAHAEGNLLRRRQIPLTALEGEGRVLFRYTWTLMGRPRDEREPERVSAQPSPVSLNEAGNVHGHDATP